MVCTVPQFRARIHNNSVSTVDSIFINMAKYNNFIVYPLVNSIYDHDAPIIVLHDIIIANNNNYIYYTSKFNKSLVLDFNFKLTYESWDNVFSYDDVNLSFNNFLNTYLRIFYSSFSIKKIHYTSHTKAFIHSFIMHSVNPYKVINWTIKIQSLSWCKCNMDIK